MLGAWGVNLMMQEIQILNKIRQQLAHCMAAYGDEPEELMYKLEQLVIEWYDKGRNNYPFEAK